MKFIAAQLTLVLAIGASLYLLKEVQQYPDYLIPPGSAVWGDILREWPMLFYQAGLTYLLAICGLVLAILASLLVVYAVGGNRIMTDFTLAMGTAWQTYPAIAIVPLLYIIFSDSLVARLIVVWSLAVFPCFLTFLAVGGTRVEALESFFEQVGRWPRGGRVATRLNHSARPIENAILGSGALALVGAIVAEFLLANSGLGGVIRVAKDHSNTALVLAALVMIAVANCVFFPVLRLIVRWALPGSRDLTNSKENTR